MSFAIIRIHKHKNFGSIAASARHTFRESDTPNADAKKTPLNVLNGPSSSEAVIAAVRDAVASVDKKAKNDPVLLVEYLVAASPEAWKRNGGHLDDDSDYFESALQFIRNKHGDKNVIAHQIHLDEKSPHMCVYVVPRVHEAAKTVRRSVNQKGGGRKTIEVEVEAHTKLSAKHFFGSKFALQQLQTDFAEKVGAQYELKRGLKGSRAKHRTMRQMYAASELALKALKNYSFKKPRRIDFALALIGVKTKAFKALESVKTASYFKRMFDKTANMLSFEDKLRNAEKVLNKKESDLLKREQQLLKQENPQNQLQAAKNQLQAALALIEKQKNDARKKDEDIKNLTNTVSALKAVNRRNESRARNKI